MTVGVCSWSYQRGARDVAREMEKAGVDHVQLAVCPFVDPKAIVPGGAGEGLTAAGSGGVEPIEVQRRDVEELLASGRWHLSGTMFNSAYEDYSTLETIKATGGIVPDEHWEENRELIRRAAALSAEWKSPTFMLHAGFLDETDAARRAVFTDRVRCVRDICGEHGLTLVLETGQERAEALAEFLADNPGVYANLDPANLILYGKGDPVAAVRTLAPWIRHVHVKDAKASPVPGQWGAEMPWGEGEVGAEAFIAALKSVGFDGCLAVEREAGGDRAGDIAAAARWLLARI